VQKGFKEKIVTIAITRFVTLFVAAFPLIPVQVVVVSNACIGAHILSNARLSILGLCVFLF
jgi:hypothetical protein